MINNRRNLLIKNSQPFCDRFFAIVLPCNEERSIGVAHAWHSWLILMDAIDCLAYRTHLPSSQPIQQTTMAHDKANNQLLRILPGVRLRGETQIKEGGLLSCTGKSVQYEAFGTVDLVDTFNEHIHDEIIWHQPAFFRRRFYATTQFRVAANVLA